MEEQTNQPSPSKIMQIGTGFWAILKLNCTDRHLFDFLDVLASFESAIMPLTGPSSAAIAYK